MTTKIESAIARSISHNEIVAVEVDYIAAARAALAGKGAK